MNGYDTYCDHNWAREDQHTKQCVKCGTYKGINNED